MQITSLPLVSIRIQPRLWCVWCVVAARCTVCVRRSSSSRRAARARASRSRDGARRSTARAAGAAPALRKQCAVRGAVQINYYLHTCVCRIYAV